MGLRLDRRRRRAPGLTRPGPAVAQVARATRAHYDARVSRPERDEVLALLRRIQAGRLGAHLILGGSSGVYGVSETVPAFTEDVDVLVDADWVAGAEAMIVEEMRGLGFTHQPGSPTFTAAAGLSLDLVGYSRRDASDRIGGGKQLPVMVYGDLSRLLALRGATCILPSGGMALTAAALAVAKLLTIRLEKGSKDKLQALLLIAENGQDRQFVADLQRLFGSFPADRVEDAIADAQVALLAISTDVKIAGPQAAGYAGLHRQLAAGFGILLQLDAGSAPPERPE
jgi:hypothetical protein